MTNTIITLYCNEGSCMVRSINFDVTEINEVDYKLMSMDTNLRFIAQRGSSALLKCHECDDLLETRQSPESMTKSLSRMGILDRKTHTIYNTGAMV